MEQRVSLVTLGVEDVSASREFYERIGWRSGAQPAADVVFFQTGTMVVALWSRESLAADSGLDRPGAPGAVVLAHNVATPARVDEIMAEAAAAGGAVTRAAAATFWGGYSGVFLDPDGHPWEVAHNPFWRLASDGAITLPRSSAARQDIALVPMTQTVYEQVVAHSQAEYGIEVARSLMITPEQGRLMAAEDFAELDAAGMQTPGHHFFSIVDQRCDRAIGYLWLHVRERYGELCALISDIEVDEQHRNSGAGRRVLELAEDVARELGARRIELNVFGDNARAAHLYRSSGFEVTNIKMAKVLSSS